MSSLSSVNRQLDNVEGQIAEAELKLAEKEDELERLKEAQSDLITNKNEFSGEEEICLEPEFSLKTFNGLKADSYDTFRELQLKESFWEVPVKQIGSAIEEIEDIENEIESFESRREILLTQRAALSSSN